MPHQMLSGELIGTELHALHVLLSNARARTAIAAYANARQLAWQVANYRIAPIARESSEPVVFITGNSHVPSLRAYDVSEEVWNLDDAGVWEAYGEAILERCAEMQIYIAEPEYDNALYVVDLARFEANEDAEVAPEATDEWRPIDRS